MACLKLALPEDFSPPSVSQAYASNVKKGFSERVQVWAALTFVLLLSLTLTVLGVSYFWKPAPPKKVRSILRIISKRYFKAGRGVFLSHALKKDAEKLCQSFMLCCRFFWQQDLSCGKAEISFSAQFNCEKFLSILFQLTCQELEEKPSPSRRLSHLLGESD